MTTTIKPAQVDVILVGDLNEVTAECIKSLERSDTDRYNVVIEPFKGYNKSLNDGAKQSDCDYIAFCNNDLIFKEGWFEPLKEALEHYASVSPWCPETHSQWWGGEKPKRPYASYEVGKCLAGWCIVMKRDTWLLLGGFDERFDFWCADNSYNEQLKNLGLKHALIPSSNVIHKQSVTLNQQNKKRYYELTQGGVQKYNRIFKKKLFG